MRIAACRYPLETLADFAAFARKQTELLTEAQTLGAEWVVLPEYLACELAGGQPEPIRADLGASLAALQADYPRWGALYADLARTLRLWILAGTFPYASAPGRYRNRAELYGPSGARCTQDKLQLTAFERDSGLFEPGDSLAVLDAGGPRVGIAVCYDVEFPLPVRAQREAGMRVLLVPSCTDTAAGAHRVRIGAQARALENRIAVACAVTAGALPWSPLLDQNTGQAAIYVPPDAGLPDDGRLAHTESGGHWAIADVEDAALDVRPGFSQVAGDRDWPAQNRPGLRHARVWSFPPGS